MFLAFVRGTLEIAKIDFRDRDEQGRRKKFKPSIQLLHLKRARRNFLNLVQPAEVYQSQKVTKLMLPVADFLFIA